jgi:glycyl-tRNA synthetase beta chain
MAESPRSLLLEIGTEELPSSFVDGALAALPKIVTGELGKARLSHGEVKPLGTPRRLAVWVGDVATQQLDLDEEVIGPPERTNPRLSASAEPTEGSPGSESARSNPSSSQSE